MACSLRKIHVTSSLVHSHALGQKLPGVLVPGAPAIILAFEVATDTAACYERSTDAPFATPLTLADGPAVDFFVKAIVDVIA